MREPDEGLGAADAGLPHDARHLYTPHPLDRQQHLLDLGPLELLGRVHQQLVYSEPPALEVALVAALAKRTLLASSSALRRSSAVRSGALRNINALVYHRPPQ